MMNSKDHEALQNSENLAINSEWSETSSTFSSSSSYSHINTETYKECCANPSDTLKNKKDFMIVESPVNASNSKIDGTYHSIRKITHFQKSHGPYSSNSHVFENIIVNDSDMEITQNSVCLNRFRKLRKLSNGEVFVVEINKSNNNEMNSVEVNMTSPKFLSKKIKHSYHFNMPDFNLSTTDTTNALITADDSNISEVKKSTVFKKPSDSSLLINDCAYNVVDESKMKLLTRKFTKRTIDTVNSAFDNIINDSSITSDNISNITKTLNDTSVVSIVNKNESCSLMELPSLNHTFDIATIGNSTQILLLSQSVENISEMHNKSMTLPVSEKITSENDLNPNKTNYNVSSSVNLKNTHSNTFTNENNLNETLNQPKYMNKTINTLSDMSNIYNQSKSSERNPHFIRKFQLDTISQGYNNIIIDDGNSTINDTLNNTENNKFKRFKLKKTCHDGNSKIVDNIISSSQTNKISVSQNTNISNYNISSTSNYSAKTSNTNDLYNISSEIKSKKNIVESIDKTLPHQPNVILEKDVETNKNMKHKSSNSLQLSGKFDFSKRFKGVCQSSVSSVIGNNTLRKKNNSLRSEKSINNHSLSNISAGLLETDGLTSLTSKNLLVSNNINLSSTSNETFGEHNSNTSNHSSIISKNENLTLNSIPSLSKQVRSQRNQSKILSPSDLSTSSISYNEGLTLFTTGLLESNISSRNKTNRDSKSEGSRKLSTTTKSSAQNVSSMSQPKASTSKDYSSHVINAKDVSNISSKSLMPEDNVSRISTRSSKQSKNSLDDNVEQELFNTEELPNNGRLTILSTTARSFEQNVSSNSQLKASTLKDYSSHVINAKDVSNVSSKSTRSSKQSKTSLPFNEGLTTIITARSSKKIVSSMSQPKASTLKDYSSHVEAKDVSSISSKSLMPEDNTTNVSRISSSLSKQSKNSLYNVKQELFNADGLPNNGGLRMLSTTVRSSEQNVSSSSQPKASTSKEYSLHINAKDVSNVSSKSTRSSKQSKSSFNNTPTILKIANGLIKHKKSSSTRVTRSSLLASTVNKSLLKRTLIDNKSMLLENNGNYISTRSYRTLSSSAKSNNETGDHCTVDDDSILWKTIPDNTTSIPIHSINVFGTPRNNKLAIKEQIINTIGIMSVNKKKSTHPGVFELEEQRPTTNLTIANSFNGTLSILTKALAGNNFNETMSDTQYLTESLIDSSQVVEETVTSKFKSLYNKEAWITKRLYNFLVSKLLPKYSIYSLKYAEKFIKYLASIMKKISDEKADLQLYTDVLRYHMARYEIINDTYDYMGFLTDYIPVKYFKKLMPNNIPYANNKVVKFDTNKIYIPIMDDEEFLNRVLDYLNV